jgi:nucleoside-diphosphate-sugar epimerase
MSGAGFRRILVTGGAGYVGAVLVPQLLARGYAVRVLDLFLYGDNVLDAVSNDPRLEIVRGDLRDQRRLKTVLGDCDAVIHLACISNDPSFELDPELGRSINYDAFRPLVEASRAAGARRFIYASSSSVYGVSDAERVTEDHPLNPLTDYSRFKGMCESILLEYQSPDFVPVIVRPATVCGYSPRQRLDVIVNILSNHAFNRGAIKVNGGAQKRPNIHIEDMVRVYLLLLELEDEIVAGRIYNVGNINHTVNDLAEMVQRVVGDMTGREIRIERLPIDDPRSYHVSSERIKRELDFEASTPIDQAVRDLVTAFQAGKLPNSFEDARYFNVKAMQAAALK